MARSAGIPFVEGDLESVRAAYSKLQSIKTKKAYPKWLASNLNKEESFSDRGLKGLLNRGRRIGGESTSDEEAYEIGIASLGGPEKGESIRKGISNRFGSEESVKEEFRRRKMAVVAAHLGKDTVSVEDYRMYHREIGFYNKNVFSWKKTQVERVAGHPVSDGDVDKLYSEYMSDRHCRSLLEVTNNGYLRSKKGWYDFLSHPNKQFYRSSWELKVLVALDEMFLSGRVNRVFTPDRIPYTFECKRRHYYPDVGWETKEGVWVGEIKPIFKISEPQNVAKFTAARSLLGDKFVILTEVELGSIMEYLHA